MALPRLERTFARVEVAFASIELSFARPEVAVLLVKDRVARCQMAVA